MSAVVPNVGTRVFSDLTPTLASINARQTYVGMCLPAPNADASILLHKPIAISTEDSDTIALLGDGVAKDTIEQVASTGISTDIIFVRCESDNDEATQLGHIVGSASNKTGVWALADAKSEIGIEPGLIIAPEYSHQRPGDAANPVVTAAEGVCEKIVDCFVIADALGATRELAAASAADFATSLNVLMGYPRVNIWKGSVAATAPMSVFWAAQILKRDGEAGNPYKAAWNRSLTGIRGVATPVGHRDGDPTSDSNFLCQAGVGTIIEQKLLWAPFTTATDPTTVGYRSIKRIRTRRSIEKAFVRAMRTYNAQDLGPHLATLIYRTISEACAERQAIGAIIGYEVIWDRSLNPNTSLRDGTLNRPGGTGAEAARQCGNAGGQQVEDTRPHEVPGPAWRGGSRDPKSRWARPACCGPGRGRRSGQAPDGCDGRAGDNCRACLRCPGSLCGRRQYRARFKPA